MGWSVPFEGWRPPERFRQSPCSSHNRQPVLSHRAVADHPSARVRRWRGQLQISFQMKRPLFLALAVCVPVVACDGFKEAMTAHVDVAARAGSQELSVTRLGELLGASKIPLRRDVVQTVADMWVNYQLLARAAAHSDTLN